ncbi:MAG TPA: hypothetical protein VLU23_20495 [Pseudolabrys sp.]|nr:hypothetical protein [Pseudolabrys sp.]
MIAYRLGPVITLATFAVVLSLSAQAQTIVHGNDFPAGEVSPVNGSFSIRFPISYRDVEYRGVETKIGDIREAALNVHMLAGIDGEGMRFSATETPLQKPLPPIDSFLETSKRRPDAVASDVQHEKKDGLEILSFTLSEPKQEYFFRVLRSKTTGYVLVVQFPTELRSKATAMKDDFFSSFKIVPH